jgi:hypothetical protein
MKRATRSAGFLMRTCGDLGAYSRDLARSGTVTREAVAVMTTHHPARISAELAPSDGRAHAHAHAHPTSRDDGG